MKKTNKNEPSAEQKASIRRQAEEALDKLEELTPETLELQNSKGLVHELRVHQIELEMQNEELHRTHDELEISRESYVDLYDFAPVGYLTVSYKGIILEANLTASTLLGISRNLLINYPLSKFILSNDQDIHYILLTQLIKTGESQSCDLRMLKANQSPFWTRIEANIANNKDNTPVFRLIISDINEEKQLAEVLISIEKEFHLLAEAMPQIVWVTRADGWNTYFNQQWVDYTGLTLEESYGHGWIKPFHPDDQQRAWDAWQNAVSNNGIYSVECKLRRKDGNYFWWLVRGVPVLDENGKISKWYGTCTNIDEIKRTEEAIKLDEARLESLLRITQRPIETIQELLDYALEEIIALTGSKIGYIYLYDETTREFSLNTWSAEVMSQCTVIQPQTIYLLEKTGIWGEAVRQRCPVIINDFNTPNPLKKGIPEGHAPLHKFLTIPVFNEEKIVAVVGVANKSENYNDLDIRQLKLMMDSVWKIVQRKQADEEHENLQQKLIQAQKMEYIGRLAGGVAHDFNNMLTAIIGYSEMAMDKVDHASPIHDDLVEIMKAAERSANLTQQLLAFARKQIIVPKILDMNVTIEGMLKMLRRLIGENINLVWLPGKNLHQVMMDSSQIDQLLANLCLNARDAISDVGDITIKTMNTTIDNYYCDEHPECIPGQYVRISLNDNGSGMDKDTLEKLFEPFFTTKEVGKGTGLGLATVYGIVKQNNGHINVYSEPGSGTTFNIYFPECIEQPNHCAENLLPSVKRGNEYILLVEDEEAILKLSKRMLESLGYQVIAAYNAKEAIELAGKCTKKIDLLLTDVIMPEMNGHDLANTLVKIYPEMKVIYMSGYTSDIILKHGILEENINFIQKPFSIKELSEEIREVLDRK